MTKKTLKLLRIISLWMSALQFGSVIVKAAVKIEMVVNNKSSGLLSI